MLLVFRLLFCLLLLPIGVHATSDFCGIKNNSFKDGEQLVFKVFYNMGSIWVGAGEANFSVRQAQYNGRETFHVIGDGKTYKSYDWIYKVRDRYESYIDVSTLLPVKFVRNVNEGGFRIYNSVNFDQANHRAVSTNGVYSVPKCIQDVLSSIYYARNIDYSKFLPGAKIPFSMFLDDQVYNLYIRYLGKETITTRYGTFNTIKFRPLLIEGTIFEGGEKMTVWVSDDENHVPVRVDSPILVGSIKVDLIGYSNLRNPFTSFLKKRQ